MGGLLKKLLYVVLGVVVLVAVAVVAFVALFDPNDYRDRISAEVKRATGRDLVIEGDLGLSVFPWLAIDVGKTRLGNAAGFGDEPFASFERARLSVRLLPMLLHREVSVGTASLDSLHLNLEVAKNGRSNWQDLIEASEAAPQAQAPAGATQPARLEIAGIDVSDASLTYTDAQAGATYRISKLHVKTGRIREGEPLPIDAGLDFELQPAGLSGDLAVETEIALDSEAGTVAFHGLRAQTLGLDVAAEVEPFSYGGEPTPVATIRIAAFSLKDLMRRLGIDPIVTADPDALGKITFGATARVSAAAIALDDVQLGVDDTTLRGKLSLARDAAGTITVDLAGDSIDLTRYMAPAAEPGQETAAQTVPVEIPAELIRSLNARGKLTLDEAQLAAMTFGNVELGLVAKDARLRMQPIHASLFGGTYDGDVRIDASAKEPVLSVNEAIRGVDIGRLAKAMFAKDNVSGSIDGTFTLSGRGADLDAVQKSLSGNMSFELKDGAFEGTDVWYELRRARALLRKETPPEPKLPARTEFSNVKLAGPVAGGVFTSDQLFAELPFMQLTGKARVDLVAATVDSQLTARILEKPELAGEVGEAELKDFARAQIPLTVTGPIAAPTIRPDVQKWLQTEAGKKLRERLTDKLLGDDKATAGGTEEGQPDEKKSEKDKLKDKLRDLLGN
ncbi:MAG: AsmA family protein [Woeseiaceae bacterium]